MEVGGREGGGVAVYDFVPTPFSGPPLPNDQFWEEWVGLREGLSADLRDLFNRMFVLTPSLQCTLRETVCHPWIASGHRLSPEEVRREMESR